MFVAYKFQNFFPKTDKKYIKKQKLLDAKLLARARTSNRKNGRDGSSRHEVYQLLKALAGDILVTQRNRSQDQALLACFAILLTFKVVKQALGCVAELITLSIEKHPAAQ